MKKISRTKVVELIQSNKGKFFTVKFTKKDNTNRTINCIIKNNGTTKLGYLNVWSIQDKGYRNIDIRTIKTVSIQGLKLKVN